jgi:hypothetical protein
MTQSSFPNVNEPGQLVLGGSAALSNFSKSRICTGFAPPLLEELELLDDELPPPLLEEEELDELDFPPLLLEEDDEDEDEELELLDDELDFPPLLEDELELLDELDELDELEELELLLLELELELELLDELELLGTAATAVLTCSVAASDTFPEVSRARTVTV